MSVFRENAVPSTASGSPPALDRAPLREIQGPRTLIALLVGILALAALLLDVDAHPPAAAA